jgi:predicted dehydrogenase
MSPVLLIEGTGAIARRHIANFRLLQPNLRIQVLRASPRPLSSPLPDDVELVASLDEALHNRPTLAIIAGPATTHVQTALPLVEAGVPVLVEKPLSSSLVEAERLLGTTQARHAGLMVAYVFRFHTALLALRNVLMRGDIGRPIGLRAEVGQYLPDWRPGMPWHESVSARSALGGGALLELSHEIDYARWLVGDAVNLRGTLRRLGAVTVDVEDWVDLHWTTADGVEVDLHMDMLQRTPHRVCRVLGSEGTADVDLIAGRMVVRRPGRAEDVVVAGVGDRNAAYVALARAALDMASGDPSSVPLEDGLAVMRIVQGARRSSELKGAEVSL